MYRFLSLLLLVGMMQEIHSNQFSNSEVLKNFCPVFSVLVKNPSKEQSVVHSQTNSCTTDSSLTFCESTSKKEEITLLLEELDATNERFFLQIGAGYTTELLIDKERPTKEELAAIKERLNTTLESLYKKLETIGAFSIILTYDRGDIQTGKSSYYNARTLPINRTQENIDSFNKCVQGIIANLSQ